MRKRKVLQAGRGSMPVRWYGVQYCTCWGEVFKSFPENRRRPTYTSLTSAILQGISANIC